VSGPSHEPLPAADEIARVRSAAEMHRAVFDRAEGADVIVMAAAVANYAPPSVAAQKIPHDTSRLTIELSATRDVLSDLAKWRTERGGGPLLVGFAAETHDVVDRARAKRLRKGVDLIVANDVSGSEAGLESDRNAVTLIDDDGETTVALAPKVAVAEAILDRIERLRSAPRRVTQGA